MTKHNTPQQETAAFDYFCAIYSKRHPGVGIIIAMCNYLQRDFAPKRKIREGHL